MQSKTVREVVSRTSFTTESEHDGGKTLLEGIFAAIHEFRSTGKLTVDFSQGSICGQPTFEERKKASVE